MVQVVIVRRRTPLKPQSKPAAQRDAPLQLSDVIERVSRIKDMARTMKGIGHTNRADAFVEAKDEIRSAAQRLEDDLRHRGVSNT